MLKAGTKLKLITTCRSLHISSQYINALISLHKLKIDARLHSTTDVLATTAPCHRVHYFQLWLFAKLLALEAVTGVSDMYLYLYQVYLYHIYLCRIGTTMTCVTSLPR